MPRPDPAKEPKPAKDPAKVLSGRIGAHESWARTVDRPARTKPARDALDRKFLDAADGDPIRADHLRKAHFARLAMKSAMARRKRPLRVVPDAAVGLEAEGGGPDAAA